MRNEVDQFILENLDTTEIIGRIFMYEGESYRVLDIEKSWGEAPIIISNLIIQNSKGIRSTFRLVSKQSFVDGMWNCQIIIL